MTGQELIDCIKKYHLEDSDILRQNPNSQDGDYITFSIPNPKPEDVGYNKVLWITDNYYQDVIFCKEGELTYGIE